MRMSGRRLRLESLRSSRRQHHLQVLGTLRLQHHLQVLERIHHQHHLQVLRTSRRQHHLQVLVSQPLHHLQVLVSQPQHHLQVLVSQPLHHLQNMMTCRQSWKAIRIRCCRRLQPQWRVLGREPRMQQLFWWAFYHHLPHQLEQPQSMGRRSRTIRSPQVPSGRKWDAWMSSWTKCSGNDMIWWRPPSTPWRKTCNIWRRRTACYGRGRPSWSRNWEGTSLVRSMSRIHTRWGSCSECAAAGLIS